MKIGLILSFRGTNYGMMLQAFATQSYLDSKKISNEIITITPDITVKNSVTKVFRHLSPAALSSSLKKRKRRKIVAADRQISSAYNERANVGRVFISEYLHDIVCYSGYENATKATKNKYDCVLIGSDQQWAPACFYSPLNTLLFVPDDVIKASYATSMGVSEIPFYTRKRLRQFIERMDYVSVREETGRKIIQGVCKRTDVEVVADPTLLLTCADWEKAIADSELSVEPYVFCYFLGDSVEPIRLVNSYAKSVGLKVIAVRNIESYSTEKVDYEDAVVLDGPTVDEFVNYIRHAELVCTDSFHATVFSLINSVEFATFYRTKHSDKNSRNSRIDDLLNKLGLSNRVCYGERSLKEITKEKIDYAKVQDTLSTMREHGRAFIEKIISGSDKKRTVCSNVTEYSREECCGCGVCSLKCPKKIISMVADDEGFFYPRIEKSENCIQCGVCASVCPVHNRERAKTIDLGKAYYAYSKDEALCKKSASGGVAQGLYKSFVSESGRCYGATYSKDFKSVIYKGTASLGETNEFLGSKYVKADQSLLYQNVKEDLKTQKVIVIGLPCDIAALKQYIGDGNTTQRNLYACEVICHGPTTPIALESYVSDLEKKESSKLVALNCRDKRPYWKPYYISACFENGDEVSNPFTGSALERAFQAVKRPSCNSCSFKDGSSCADLIIGDYHAAKKGTKEYNPYGVSICFPITEKGTEMLKMLEDGGYAIGVADPQRAVANKALTTSLEKLGIRKRFVRILRSDGLSAAANDPFVVLGLKKRRIVMKLNVYKKALLSKIK